MADNNENFSLTHEDHRRIFEELKAQNFSGRKASKNPRAVILGGQPGSGRSSQIPRIMQGFSSEEAVLIDERHTQGYTKPLFEEAIQGKFNIVIKDTLPNSEMLKSLRENGYSTSVYVVSAHERESILSLYERYEAQIEARGIGDKPKISEHDEIYKLLPSMLQKIEDEKLADELLIINRDGRINYRNELKNNEWTTKSKSSQVLEESRNRAWTAEEILKYQEDWNAVFNKMTERGASKQELEEVAQVRNRCLKSLKSQEKIAEMNKVEENEIESAVSLLKNPRSLDNSSFRGYEASAQQNDTLDVLDQIKRNVQESKTALEKLKQAGLSPEKDITKNKIVRPGQFPNLKGAEVISRTKDTLTLVKGRSLFIYELKRLELKAPALGQPGEKLDLRWPAGQEKARGTKALERDQHHSRVRTQQEDMK